MMLFVMERELTNILQPFRRVAYITKHSNFNRKFSPKAKKCSFVGYTEDHSPDTFYCNRKTNKVSLSRDFTKWLDWHGRIADVDVMELIEQLETLK